MMRKEHICVKVSISRRTGKYYRYNGNETENRCPERGEQVFDREMMASTGNFDLIINYTLLEMKLKTANGTELTI